MSFLALRNRVNLVIRHARVPDFADIGRVYVQLAKIGGKPRGQIFVEEEFHEPVQRSGRNSPQTA